MLDWLRQRLKNIGIGSETVEQVHIVDEAIKVLLVDDTPDNLQILVETLKPMGYKLLVARDEASALALVRRAKPALILLDVMMPGMDGYEVCARLKADPELSQAAVIFCSALDDTQAKVKGLQLGAVDFITKPFEPEEVIARVGTHLAVQQLATSLQAQNAALRLELEIAREHQRQAIRRLEWALLGTSNAAHMMRSALQAYAQKSVPVLLRGPLFCGQEAAALAIHAASARKDRPFITVDCSRLTPQEESEIFDSSRDSPSKLKLATGGTLYLEQVQYLSEPAQHRLLTCLGEPLGIIAYAGEDPPWEGDSQLRDLLAQNTLSMPPLAQRRGDLGILARELLLRHARRLGKPATDLEPESLERLQEYKWEGNLRELEDVVVRSLAASTTALLKIDKNLLQGGTALGSYRLLKKLGEGGMGEVWRAQHQLLARPAAVKLIRGEHARDAETLERFQREARATSQLTSPHTVTLYDFGVSEKGEFYYVMELLEGVDLDAVLARSGPLSPIRAAYLLVQACKSLAEAHQLGIVHRDLKPSNLFLCRLGIEFDFLKILDFGLVRWQPGPDEQRLTGEGEILCTPDYVAPETVTGTDVIDGRTDIYSLGATFYHLLAGKPVFSGVNTLQLVFQHASKPAPPLQNRAEVPAPLAELIMTCLSKEMAERPTAAQLVDRLLDTGLPQQWTAAQARACSAPEGAGRIKLL